jgi:hypothetical protein
VAVAEEREQATKMEQESMRAWVLKGLGWGLAGIGFVCRVVLLGWATLALYYSNLPWAWLRLVMAVLFLAVGIWAFWLTRRPRASLAFTGLFLGVFVWWSFIQPSHERPWRPEVAVMPRAVIEGDRVRITGVRNFVYRSRDDFTVRYEERQVSLSHLSSVDLFVSYWRVGPVGHTFLSFNFDSAPPLSISIETRPEVGEGFARENVRRLFLVYLDRINELADRAEFYHLLSNSCTINIVRYANLAGRVGRFDIRHLLNGFIDRYLYGTGALGTALPFDELRRRSRINDAAQAAVGAPDFSQRIRADLPTMPP